MLSYEICKKLKEAGFKQDINFKTDFFYYEDCEECINGNPEGGRETHDVYDDYKDKLIKIPTLEELTEACGEKFTYLEHIVPQKDFPEVRWCAKYESVGGGIETCGDGKTAIESVALLFLAINKKEE